jgi:peptide/nickel transport system substrate-binding protein
MFHCGGKPIVVQRAILLVCLVLAIVGCGSPASTPASRPADGVAASPSRAPKRIVAAIRGLPPALNYSVMRTGAGGTPGLSELDLLLNPGLAITDADGNLQPRAAEAVPTLENGLWKLLPDGRMETTWHIVPGATWDDGAPLTSADLVFTTIVQQDRELPLIRPQPYDYIEDVEALDPRTVVVRWNRPYIEADAMFTSRLALPIPIHLLEETYRTDKSKLTGLDYWTTGFVGIGPYRLREWAVGSHVILEANDRYVRGRPKVDTMELRFVTDPNTLIANVLAGEIDVAFGRGTTAEQALEVRSLWRDGKADITPSSWYATYPQFMNANPPAQTDVRFRRALISAIDRQGLVDTFLPGVSSVAHTMLLPGDAQYAAIEPSLVKYNFDRRGAQQLLTEVGFTPGPDGGLRDATGQRLTIEQRASTDNPLYERLALAIAADWQAVGVATETNIYPRQMRDDIEWRQTRPAFELLTQPAEVQRFHSNGTPLPENRFRGDNRTRYNNPELDTLIDRYFLTIPMQERMGTLGQVVRHLSDQVVAIGLVYDAQPMLISNKLLNASAAAQTTNANEWDVR